MQKRDFIMHDNLDKPSLVNTQLPVDKSKEQRKTYHISALLPLGLIGFCFWIVALLFTWIRDDGYSGYGTMFNVVLWTPFVVIGVLTLLYSLKTIRDIVYFDGIEQNRNIFDNDKELEKLRLQVRIEEAKAEASKYWTTNAPSQVSQTTITPKDKDDDELPNFNQGGNMLGALLDD